MELGRPSAEAVPHRRLSSDIGVSPVFGGKALLPLLVPRTRWWISLGNGALLTYWWLLVAGAIVSALIAPFYVWWF